jgi:extradiol dioxygenase family protein
VIGRFHLAFPVRDVESTRWFYTTVLGAGQGRASDRWIDFDFGGHQISAHLAEMSEDGATSEVDGKPVPLRHFGLILAWADWEALVARIRAQGVPFALEPMVRFAGQPAEQGTFFVRDPSGNALEFKAFREEGHIF